MPRAALAPSLSLMALSLLAAACSRAVVPQQPSQTPDSPAQTSAPPPLEAGVSLQLVEQPPRRVGDVRVVRFSGSFRRGELLLREEVVELGKHTLTIDYTLDDGFEPETLRVVHTRDSERVVEVTRKTGDAFVPAGLEDFETLLHRTSFAPSHNRGETASREETCLVGMDEYECSVRSYAVLVGEKEATLTVSRASAQDLSGEVVAVDGTLLYRAQTLELRQGDELPPDSNPSLASH